MGGGERLGRAGALSVQLWTQDGRDAGESERQEIHGGHRRLPLLYPWLYGG